VKRLEMWVLKDWVFLQASGQLACQLLLAQLQLTLPVLLYRCPNLHTPVHTLRDFHFFPQMKDQLQRCGGNSNGFNEDCTTGHHT
jgi:hypothetical protein